MKYWVLSVALVCGVFGVTVATDHSPTAEAALTALPPGTYRFVQDPPSLLSWDVVIPETKEIVNWPYPSPGGLTYPWDPGIGGYRTNAGTPAVERKIVITGGRWFYFTGSNLAASGTVTLLPPVPPVPPKK